VSNISEAREQLEIIAQMTDKETAQRIRQVIRRYMYRDPFVRRAKPQSSGMTPELSARIRQTAQSNPKMPLQRIAEIYNVNPGRVSEVLNGKRK
jgi:hypothetical protein